jgi:DNA-binding HxlR family transcriptional regulator
MQSMKKYCKDEAITFCPVETGIELLSGKWKGRILWKLYNIETLRFGELRLALGNITDKMLRQQLRQLEKVKLVNRQVFAGFPPKVEYSLTDFGKNLSPILNGFADWGVANKELMTEIFEGRK